MKTPTKEELDTISAYFNEFAAGTTNIKIPVTRDTYINTYISFHFNGYRPQDSHFCVCPMGGHEFKVDGDFLLPKNSALVTLYIDGDNGYKKFLEIPHIKAIIKEKHYLFTKIRSCLSTYLKMGGLDISLHNGFLNITYFLSESNFSLPNKVGRFEDLFKKLKEEQEIFDKKQFLLYKKLKKQFG